MVAPSQFAAVPSPTLQVISPEADAVTVRPLGPQKYAVTVVSAVSVTVQVALTLPGPVSKLPRSQAPAPPTTFQREKMWVGAALAVSLTAFPCGWVPLAGEMDPPPPALGAPSICVPVVSVVGGAKLAVTVRCSFIVIVQVACASSQLPPLHPAKI